VRSTWTSRLNPPTRAWRPGSPRPRNVGGPHVAKMVEHIPEQSWKAGMVQPITIEPSVGPDGGVGVVAHLSKTRKKWISISSIEQRQQTRTQNKSPRQHVNSDSDSDRWRSHKTLLSETGVESGKLLDTKVIDNFETFPKKYKYNVIRPTVQELRPLQFGGVRSGQIKLYGQIWTLRPLAKEFWKNSEYQNPR
jgi:hypothetical protein